MGNEVHMQVAALKTKDKLEIRDRNGDKWAMLNWPIMAKMPGFLTPDAMRSGN